MTSFEIGVLTAIGAMISWTIGDYFIQKATREIGVWKALFYNGFFGLLMLTPFVYKEIPGIFSSSKGNYLLLTVALITFVAALLEYTALKKGELSVIEPVLSLELLFTVFLSIFLLNESLAFTQILLVILAFLGILFAVTKKLEHLKIHKKLFERGVLLAIVGALTMGTVNFLTGVSARETSPLLTLWAVEAVLMVACVIYMIIKRDFPNLITDIKKYPVPILSEGIIDNLGWIFFAYSMTLIPISIATTISEAYVVFVVLLGIKLNKEAIQPHQKIGAGLAIGSILILVALGF